MREEIVQLIQQALGELGLFAADIQLEHPEDLQHGDYSTNVALVLAREMGEPALALAEKISQRLAGRHPALGEVSAAPPGFVNFFLAPQFLAGELGAILRAGDGYGRHQGLAGQKVMVEYTDPNLFKEFHLGHLMSNTVGEAIARLIEAGGAEVRRANYQSDLGLNVAKAVWGLKQAGRPPASAAELGAAYAAGARAYDQDELARLAIEALNRKLYQPPLPAELETLYERGKEISLAHFEQIYERLGTKFDFYFFESETGVLGKRLVEGNLGQVFESSEGAAVFRGENHDLHTRVFLTKDSLPTYEAKELGLAQIKYEHYPYDRSLIITGNEVNDYFKVLLKVMELVLPELATRTTHLSHGMLRLPAGKMSSRRGTVITAEALLDEVKGLAEKKMKTPGDGKIAEAVAVAAVKYAILKQSPGKDIIFDAGKSLSLEGDSGPYLQYTAVRSRSVLVKADGRRAELNPVLPEGEPVSSVERLLHRFPEVVARAGREYAPQQLVSYLVSLASAFNGYYAKHQILGATTTTGYRLALTAACVQVFKTGLWLLGLPEPERM